MDARQQRTIARYRRIARSPLADPASAVNRPSSELGKGNAIWQDIRAKVGLQRGAKVLDIGCGFGEVVRYCLADAKRLALDLVLVDIREIVQRIEQDFSDLLTPRVRRYGGAFPVDMPSAFRRERDFDCIIAYSVLHYTDRPRSFIAAAARLLAPGGRLLVGDLPNVHRKGRFLVSDAGRRFEARYRGVSEEALPRFRDQHDYFRRCRDQNKRVNDALVVDTIRTYRKRGFDVYVTPQPAHMPFSHTREDLLICRR